MLSFSQLVMGNKEKGYVYILTNPSFREEELNRLLAVLGTNSEIIQQNNQQEEKAQDTVETLEEWKARALRAESELAILRGKEAAFEGLTAEEYLARLQSSMRFVLSFITQEKF